MTFKFPLGGITSPPSSDPSWKNWGALNSESIAVICQNARDFDDFLREISYKRDSVYKKILDERDTRGQIFTSYIIHSMPSQPVWKNDRLVRTVQERIRKGLSLKEITVKCEFCGRAHGRPRKNKLMYDALRGVHLVIGTETVLSEQKLAVLNNDGTPKYHLNLKMCAECTTRIAIGERVRIYSFWKPTSEKKWSFNKTINAYCFVELADNTHSYWNEPIWIDKTKSSFTDHYEFMREYMNTQVVRSLRVDKERIMKIYNHEK
jgi:hypothetical protein